MAGMYFVAGGAGSIGSHLAEALVARGDSVIALDNLTTGELSDLGAVMDTRICGSSTAPCSITC